jgi:hypothetical protein
VPEHVLYSFSVPSSAVPGLEETARWSDALQQWLAATLRCVSPMGWCAVRMEGGYFIVIPCCLGRAL